MSSRNRIIGLIAVAVIGGLATLYTRPGSGSEELYGDTRYINGQAMHLDIARTDTEHYQGLSDRPEMCSECGMLFVFGESKPRSFVMRRMNFPLDMVWLSGGTVVHISRNAQPEKNGPYTAYTAGQPIDAVIELNAGAAERYGLEAGQIFELPKL